MSRGFRVWDIESECYLPVSIGSNDGVLGVTIDGTGIIYLEDGEANIQLTGVIIEQDTGLKDTKGKKIYVGDIVEVFSTDEYEMDFEGVCRVYFDDYWLSYQMYKLKSPYTKITFEPEMYDNIEIIGNIHENPELIGGEK